MIRGAVDQITTDGAIGWVFNTLGPEKLNVQAVLDHQIIGEGLAGEKRPDLADAGLGDGYCGFQITFFRQIDPAFLPFVLVKPSGGDIELPRVNFVGYRDFLSSVYARYPLAGRSRCILGGLWTDRVDALANLDERCDLGLAPAEAAPAIKDIIVSGYTVLAQYSETRGGGTAVIVPLAAEGVVKSRQNTNALGVAEKVLFSPEVLGVLPWVLEGHPIAIHADSVTADSTFVQASTHRGLTSPAECLALVTTAAEDEVFIDVVRGSHLLPEFSTAGTSRWTTKQDFTQFADGAGGAIDRVTLKHGQVAIIGPGLIHAIRVPRGRQAVRFICVPKRNGVSASVTPPIYDVVHATGAQIRAMEPANA